LRAGSASPPGEQIADLRRRAEQAQLRGLGRKHSGSWAEEDNHADQAPSQPGEFDPGHCQDCAHETSLSDHYWHVQRQERAFTDIYRWARHAHRQAIGALWPLAPGSCSPSSAY
jgi:hypothetical protein